MISCQFEDGGKASLRHAVTDAIVLNESRNSILLVKRAPHLLAGGQWAIPGGYLDLGETSATAALREVQEETGYEAQIERLFEIIDNPKRHGDSRQNIVFIYIMIAGEKVSEADPESTDVRWFKFDQIPPSARLAFDHSETIQRFLSAKESDANISIISTSQSERS